MYDEGGDGTAQGMSGRWFPIVVSRRRTWYSSVCIVIMSNHKLSSSWYSSNHQTLQLSSRRRIWNSFRFGCNCHRCHYWGSLNHQVSSWLRDEICHLLLYPNHKWSHDDDRHILRVAGLSRHWRTWVSIPPGICLWEQRQKNEHKDQVIMFQSWLQLWPLPAKNNLLLTIIIKITVTIDITNIIDITNHQHRHHWHHQQHHWPGSPYASATPPCATRFHSTWGEKLKTSKSSWLWPFRLSYFWSHLVDKYLVEKIQCKVLCNYGCVDKDTMTPDYAHQHPLL